MREIGPSLVLDLSGVTFMDSTGLKVLLAVHQRAQLAGGRLVLAGATRSVQRVVSITGLDETFEVRDNVEAAVAVFSGERTRPRSRPFWRPDRLGSLSRHLPRAAGDGPAPDRVDALLDLRGARLRRERPAAGLPQLGVDRPVRHAGAVVPGTDQRVELLAQRGQRPVQGFLAAAPD